MSSPSIESKMKTSTSFIPIWIVLIILTEIFTGFTTADDAGNGTLNTRNVNPLENPTKKQGNATTRDTNRKPEFSVWEVSGTPCILASLNISLRISYPVKSKERLALKTLEVPVDADIIQESTCGVNLSSLVLTWANSSLVLNLTFVTLGQKEGESPTNWTLNTISVGYNLSNAILFPAISGGEFVWLDKTDLKLFTAPLGVASECDKDIKVQLGNDSKGTRLHIQYAKIAAFNLTSEEFPKEVSLCKLRPWSPNDEDITIPLIIACSLSGTVVLVVIGYAISRKVQEVRDQSQYKPMP